MHRTILFIVLAAFVTFAAVAFAACTAPSPHSDDDLQKQGFVQISQAEAVERMGQADGHIILDVRREDEFAAGHIPDAICLPNESIGNSRPSVLPDLNQILLIYCRSGNRSKQAAQKLANLGYTQVYEFGGILDWQGETVTGSTQKEYVLQFESFDGGGPNYSVEAADPSIVSWSISRQYSDPDHELLDGASYSVRITLTALQPGRTTLTVTANSPIQPSEQLVYDVLVDSDLRFLRVAQTEG